MNEQPNNNPVPMPQGEQQVNFSSPQQAAPPAAPYQAPWQSQTQQAISSRRKSPALAGFLSLLPGLGQVYVGYYQQGFVNVAIVGAVISILNMNLGSLEPLAGFFLAFFWLFNIVDASRKAAMYNEALAGLRPMDLPEDIVRKGGAGSLAGGIGLIVLGSLAFANTMFDIPLEWIEDWWPIGLVAVGAYLVWASFAARKDADEKAQRHN